MGKKYEFTEETSNYEDHILHRIKALRDFGNVKAGDLGGWIEKEKNLSHIGDCWIADNARVYNNARVCDDAMVRGNAEVYGDARVFGDAEVFDNAQVYDRAEVFDNAWVYGGAKVYSNARVYDNAWVFGNAKVCDDAMVFGDYITPRNNSNITNDIYKIKIPRNYLIGVESDDMIGSFITFTYTDENGKDSRQVTGLVYEANRFAETLNLFTAENITNNDAEVEFYFNRMSDIRFTTPTETIKACEDLAKKYNKVFSDSHIAKDVLKYATSEDAESVRKEVLEVLKKHNWTEEDLWAVYSEVAEEEDW